MQQGAHKKHPIPAELEKLFESSARSREALFERHIQARVQAEEPQATPSQKEEELLELASTLQKARATLRRFRPANDGDTLPSVPVRKTVIRRAKTRAQASSRLRVRVA